MVKGLRYKGLKVLEIFAGIMCLTMVAVSFGWVALDPVDLRRGDDLYISATQRGVLDYIDQEKPDLVTLSFPCKYWSPLQNILSKRPGRKQRLGRLREQERKLVRFTQRVMRRQEARGDLAIAENPHASDAWKEGRWPGQGAVLDQCRCGLHLPGSRRRVRKRTRLQCVPGGLAEAFSGHKCQCRKPHDIVFGSWKMPDGSCRRR